MDANRHKTLLFLCIVFIGKIYGNITLDIRAYMSYITFLYGFASFFLKSMISSLVLPLTGIGCFLCTTLQACWFPLDVKSHHCLVVSSTNLISMSAAAVVGVHREQEGTEHTALGGSTVEH